MKTWYYLMEAYGSKELEYNSAALVSEATESWGYRSPRPDELCWALWRALLSMTSKSLVRPRFALILPSATHHLFHLRRQNWIGIIWCRVQGSAQGRSHGIRHEGDRSARDVKKGAVEGHEVLQINVNGT